MVTQTLSEKLDKAIGAFLEENPQIEIEYGTEEARTLAARFLAKNQPEAFDSENPTDNLLQLLAEMEDGGPQ